MSTPFDSSVRLFPIENEHDIINQKEYTRVIGSLRYAIDCTRPNIAYTVEVFSRFTSKSGKEHCMLLNILWNIYWERKTMVYIIKNILLLLRNFPMLIGIH